MSLAFCRLMSNFVGLLFRSENDVPHQEALHIHAQDILAALHDDFHDLSVHRDDAVLVALYR